MFHLAPYRSEIRGSDIEKDNFNDAYLDIHWLEGFRSEIKKGNFNDSDLDIVFYD